MVQASPPSPLREEDYEAIEAAVMETERGRWFLAEYTRRNRSADTNVLLEAIQKLERSMRREHKGPQINRIQLDLADMQEAIIRTKQEIAQIKHESDDGDRFTEASNELDAIITQTEGATQDILNTTEKIQELAWTLREQGVDEKVCDEIDAHSTDIYMACSFQDLTGQRTQKVVQVLRYLESRINEMMNIWGLEDVDIGDVIDGDRGPLNPDDARPDAHLLNGPQLSHNANDQNEIDALMDVAAAHPPLPEFDTVEAAAEAEVEVEVETPSAEPAVEEAEATADLADDEMEVVDDLPAENAADALEAEIAAAAAEADSADDGVDFTFVGSSSRQDDEQQADVFAPAEETAAPKTEVELVDAEGADVFAGDDINATLSEMVGDDDEDASMAMADADALDSMFDGAGHLNDEVEEAAADMSESVSELSAPVRATDAVESVADVQETEIAAEDDGEDDADAMFEAMDKAEAEDEEPAPLRADGACDPLSGLSSGERMALFS